MLAVRSLRLVTLMTRTCRISASIPGWPSTVACDRRCLSDSNSWLSRTHSRMSRARCRTRRLGLQSSMRLVVQAERAAVVEETVAGLALDGGGAGAVGRPVG